MLRASLNKTFPSFFSFSYKQEIVSLVIFKLWLAVVRVTTIRTKCVRDWFLLPQSYCISSLRRLTVRRFKSCYLVFVLLLAVKPDVLPVFVVDAESVKNADHERSIYTHSMHRECVMIGRKEMFYLTTHSTHFIYGYMASGIW